MANKLSLQEKIRMVMRRTGMSAANIAYATGLSRENMYKWVKGTRPSDSVTYEKLVSYLDGILERVTDDSAEEPAAMYGSLFERPSTMKVPLKRIGKPVPQTSAKAAAGTIVIMNDEPQLIVDRIDAPVLGEIDGLIEMTGDSMEPTFKNGCRVAISRLKDPMLLEWGKYYYIIDKNWQGLVCRIYPGESENSLKLLSDNSNLEKYPPIVRRWDHIEAIYKIKAEIIKH